MSTFWIVIITAMPSLAAGFLIGMQFGRMVQFENDLAIVRGGNERVVKSHDGDN